MHHNKRSDLANNRMDKYFEEARLFKNCHARRSQEGMMKIRRRTVALLLVLDGYVLTWLIAPPMAKRHCERRAEQAYAMGLEYEQHEQELMREMGEDTETARPIVHAGGPSTSTGLAIPVLPGILMLNNSYHVGPLFAKGQVSFFLFYGFGVCRLFEFTTWIS